MAGLKFLDNASDWVTKFFKRKDANLEKDASKASMSGDTDTMRRITSKLYRQKRGK